MAPFPNTLSLVRSQAAKFNTKTYAIFSHSDEPLTYGELYSGSAALSVRMEAQGLRKGGRVSFYAPKSKLFLLHYVAALNLGLLTQVSDEKTHLSDLFKIWAMFTPDRVYCEAQEVTPLREKISAVHFEKTPEIYPLEAPTSREDPSADDRTDRWIRSVESSDPAICVFTSGSTGGPKGVVSSHGNILFGASCLEAQGVTEEDRVLSVTPLSGTNGQIFTLWGPLFTGGSVVFDQGMFQSFSAIDLILRHGATWFNGTPSHLSILVNYPSIEEGMDLSRWKFARSASAPLPDVVKRRFEELYRVPVINTMGLTEMTGQVFSQTLGDDRQPAEAIGKPYRTRVKVIDPQTGQMLPPCQVGELAVTSPGLMLGYFDDPVSTGKAVRDYWLHTGDLGMIDASGYVYLKGRIKDIAIIGGQNVALSEVDQVLMEHRSICHAACVAVPDEISGEKIIACVELVKDKSAEPDEIIHHCRRRLSLYKCPVQVIFIKKLPMGGSGKILRSKTKEMLLQEGMIQ